MAHTSIYGKEMSLYDYNIWTKGYADIMAKVVFLSGCANTCIRRDGDLCI